MMTDREMQNLIEIALETYDRLMDLAMEEGRGDLYLKYYERSRAFREIKIQ